MFVNLDPDAEPLLDFLDPLPDAARAVPPRRACGSAVDLTTILPANWKVVVDAFNEAYHVQGTHPQILPWTDDVSIEYEQLGKHAHYGRLPERAPACCGRARASGSPTTSTTRARSSPGSSAGSAARSSQEERALVDELRAAPGPAGTTLLAVYQRRRMELLASRGLDVSGFAPEQMTSADDVYWFPNLVGPIYPGSAILFRVRPDGLDPDTRDPGHLGARVAATRRRVAHARSAASSPTGASATGARSRTRTTPTWSQVQTGHEVTRASTACGSTRARRATSCTCTA